MIDEPSRSDLKLIEQAIRKGWDIPEQLLSALPKVAGAMALNGKPREKLAAMRVLLAMKEQNDKSDPVVSKVNHEHTHTHKLGPVTAENIEQQRAARIARYARPSQS